MNILQKLRAAVEAHEIGLLSECVESLRLHGLTYDQIYCLADGLVAGGIDEAKWDALMHECDSWTSRQP